MCMCENLSFFVCKGFRMFIGSLFGHRSLLHVLLPCQSSVSAHFARQYVHYMVKRDKRNRGKSSQPLRRGSKNV